MGHNGYTSKMVGGNKNTHGSMRDERLEQMRKGEREEKRREEGPLAEHDSLTGEESETLSMPWCKARPDTHIYYSVLMFQVCSAKKEEENARRMGGGRGWENVRKREEASG
uniref:Uncharacterized protein n=1 Tax=Oryza brachyantha TaxID=4533 RepID=J3MKY0_ORYBR